MYSRKERIVVLALTESCFVTIEEVHFGHEQQTVPCKKKTFEFLMQNETKTTKAYLDNFFYSKHVKYALVPFFLTKDDFQQNML